MTTEPNERPLDRRLLLRGGAVLAGAAGVAAVSALAPATAQAADGQFAVMGQSNTSDATTLMALNAPGGALPTLQLTNASGPALDLTPTGLGYDGTLQV
jgi:cell division septal protein FtsQ